MQKRDINDNENTISLTKTITKTKIKSKTKLTLISINPPVDDIVTALDTNIFENRLV